MQKDQFSIGTEFYTAAGRWRCTDIGQRTICAIKLEHEDDPSWYEGPPYAVAEEVFDEYDLDACSLEPYPDVNYGRVRRDREGQVAVEFHLDNPHRSVWVRLGPLVRSTNRAEADLFYDALKVFADHHGIELPRPEDKG